MVAWRTLALVALVALAGCIEAQPETEKEDADKDAGDARADAPACTPPTVQPTGPGGGQSGVSNQPGSFTYGGQSAAKTAKEVYLWENPSAAASVTWGGQAGTGTLKITMQDHCGKEVYSREIAGASQQGGASESTSEGEPGSWILTFEFTLYTGQMGLSITSA